MTLPPGSPNQLMGRAVPPDIGGAEREKGNDPKNRNSTGRRCSDCERNCEPCVELFVLALQAWCWNHLRVAVGTDTHSPVRLPGYETRLVFLSFGNHCPRSAPDSGRQPAFLGCDGIAPTKLCF